MIVEFTIILVRESFDFLESNVPFSLLGSIKFLPSSLFLCGKNQLSALVTFLISYVATLLVEAYLIPVCTVKSVNYRFNRIILNDFNDFPVF